MASIKASHCQPNPANRCTWNAFVAAIVMSKLNAVLVSLSEVLEVRGKPLSEPEVWSVLAKAVVAIQDACLRGESLTNEDHPIVTSNLLQLHPNGEVLFDINSESVDVQNCASVKDIRFEKICIGELGVTLTNAMEYNINESQSTDYEYSLLLCDCLKSMREMDLSNRCTLESLFEIVKSAALCKTNGKPFSFYIINMYSEVLGLFSELSGNSKAVMSGNCEEEKSADLDLDSRDSSEIEETGPTCEKKMDLSFKGGLKQSDRSKDCIGGRESSSITVQSESQSGFDRGSSKYKKCVGPEFVQRSYLPSIKLSLKTNSGRNSSVLPKTVTIICLTGQRFEIECHLDGISANDILTLIIEKQNLKEKFLFGLAYVKANEFVFLDLYDKLSKMLPNQNGGGLAVDTFTLYLRVKFYLDIIFLRHTTTRHMFYLQLRKDVLEKRISSNRTNCMILASYAMQVEHGNDTCNVVTLDHYFPAWIIENGDGESIRNQLVKLHLSHRGMTTDLARENFLNKVQMLSDYGYHFHGVFRDNSNPESQVLLGISLQGISIFDEDIPTEGESKLELQRYLWENILRIWSDKRHFFFTLQHRNLKSHLQKYRFYTKDNLGKYLFQLATCHHRLHLRLISQTEDLVDVCPERETNNNERNYDIGTKKDLIEECSSQRRPRSLKALEASKKKVFRASSSPNPMNVDKSKRSTRQRGKSALKAKLLAAILKRHSENIRNGSLEESNPISMEIIWTPCRSDAIILDSTPKSQDGTPVAHPEVTVNASLAERFANLTGIEKSSERKITRVCLCRNAENNSLGIKVCEGVDGATYIQSVDTQNASLNIKQGDRIVAVNGKYVESLPYPKVVDLIRNTAVRVQLILSQAVVPLQMASDSGPSPSVFAHLSTKDSTLMSVFDSTPRLHSKNCAELMPRNEKLDSEPHQKWILVQSPNGSLKNDDRRRKTDTRSFLTNFHAERIGSDHTLKERESKVPENNSAFNSNRPENCQQLFGDGHPLTLINTESNTNGNSTVFTDLQLKFSGHRDSKEIMLREWNYCTNVFNVVLEKIDGDIGIKLMSHAENTQDGPVVIESLTKYGAAHQDGRIKPGDTIIEIGGVNVCGLPHCEVISLLRGGPQVIHLAVQRNTPAPPRTAFWCQPKIPVQRSVPGGSALDEPEAEYNCCHRPIEAKSESGVMVSKLNKSSEDVSDHPASPDYLNDVPKKTAFWQPKISGAVKNKISDIESHHPPAYPAFVEQPPLQGQCFLSKKSLSQSTQDLSCQQYSSNGPKLKFMTKFPSLQNQVNHFEKSEPESVTQVLRDGNWCPAVVSKPYRPRSSRCMPRLMRSKTLPAVYSTPIVPAGKTDSTEELSIMTPPESPPPWLAHLKGKGLHQRGPWWSRTNSIDASGGAGLPPAATPPSPVAKKVPASPTLKKSPFFGSPAPTSPTVNRVPASPTLKKFTFSGGLAPSSPPLNRVPVTPTLKKAPFSGIPTPPSPTFNRVHATPAPIAKPFPGVRTQTSPTLNRLPNTQASKKPPISGVPVPVSPTFNRVSGTPPAFEKSPTLVSPNLNRLPTAPTPKKVPFSAPVPPPQPHHILKMVASSPPVTPTSPKPIQKFTAQFLSDTNSETNDGHGAANPFSHLNGVMKSAKGLPRTCGQLTKAADVCLDSPKDLPPLRLDSKLEELHRRYLFINQDTIFDVSLTKNSRGLGIRICGGKDQDPNDVLTIFIRVKRLYPMQPALECGKLEVGDIILTVNGRHLTGLNHSEAVDVLRIAPANVSLLICRPLPGTLPPVPQDDSPPSNDSVQGKLLTLRNNIVHHPPQGPKDFQVILEKVGGSLGFTLHKKDEYHNKHGHFIKALVKDPALTDGRLQPGDQILMVNAIDICKMSHTETINFLRTCPNKVTLSIHRENEIASSPLSPLSPLPSFLPQDVSNKGRTDKKILRKEAQDLVSDTNCRRKNGEMVSSPFGSPKSLRRNRLKGQSTASNLSADSTSENLSSDADSQRSSPMPTKEIQNPRISKSESFGSALASGVSRDSSLSSMSNGSSTSLFKVSRPSFIGLKPGTFKMASTSSVPDSGQAHVPALCVSKYESDGTTPSTEDTDSDSSGTGIEPPCRLQIVEEVAEAPVQHSSLNGECLAPLGSPKLFQKLKFLATSEESNKTGLMKWRGTVLSPLGNKQEVNEPASTSVEQLQQDAFTVDLFRSWNSRLGFSLISVEIGKLKGSFIRAIHPGSVASFDARLRPGDHLLRINGISIENMQTDDVIEMLRNLHGKILLDIVRNPVVTNSVLNILRLQSM